MIVIISLEKDERKKKGHGSNRRGKKEEKAPLQYRQTRQKSARRELLRHPTPALLSFVIKGPSPPSLSRLYICSGGKCIAAKMMDQRPPHLRGRSDSDSDSIPLADDDPAAVLTDRSEDDLGHRKDLDEDEDSAARQRASQMWKRLNDCESMDSIPSMVSDKAPSASDPAAAAAGSSASYSISEQMHRQLSLDPDFSPDEVEEKSRLIAQVTLHIHPRRRPFHFSSLFLFLFASSFSAEEGEKEIR